MIHASELKNYSIKSKVEKFLNIAENTIKSDALLGKTYSKIDIANITDAVREEAIKIILSKGFRAEITNWPFSYEKNCLIVEWD